MVRSVDAVSSRAAASEFCNLLSAKLGTIFFPHNAISYGELADAVASGSLGFAWMPPVPAIDLIDQGLATVLALPVRRGAVSYQAAMIVARGGPKTLPELKGTRVAWVDRGSTSGYIVPREHLYALGLDPRVHFSDEVFLHGHDNVVDAVVSGRAAMGATFVSLEPGSQNVAQAGWTDAAGRNPKAVEIVATAGPIPNDAFVVSKRVPEDVAAGVLACLMDNESPEAKRVFMQLLRAETFQRATAAHFDPLRRVLRASRARGDSPPSVRRI